MRMRTGLANTVRAVRSLALHELCVVLQSTVFGNRQHRHGAARVVRDDHELVGRIDCLAHAVLAAGVGAADQLDRSFLRIDRECGGMVLVAVHAVKHALVAAQLQKGRVHEVADLLDVAPHAGCGVHAKDVDTVATGLALGRGERPHIGVDRTIRRLLRKCRCGHQQCGAACERFAPRQAIDAG